MSAPLTQVLTDAFTEAVGASRGRVVEAAVFTTFTLDPEFFEQHVLPTLFDVSFSTAPRVKLMQLEEQLRRTDVAVFYDPRALQTMGSAKLDVERVPMWRKRGCFHPKVALVLVSEGGIRSLVVLVSSANLTESGWWQNIEVNHLCEIEDGSVSHYREPLLQLLKNMKKEMRAKGSPLRALTAVQTFLAREVEDPPRRSRKAPLHDRLFVGAEPFPTFIRDALGRSSEDLHLEVVSPYFDRREAGALEALIQRLKPRSTTVYLPRDDSGTAKCLPELYDHVLSIGAKWGKLRTDLRKRESKRTTERFVHAKAYRLWTTKRPGREVVILGSANLTRAAHSEGIAGNVEASVLLENPSPVRLKSWFEADDVRPLQFDDAPQEEGDGFTDLPLAPLDIRFAWDTSAASAHWNARPARVELNMLDAALGAPLALEQGWNDLPAEHAEELAKQLVRTAFVTPFVGGLEDDELEEHCAILVCEEGMAHKPSLLLDLTPEDILRYWSLLSEEQRNAFIENELHVEVVAAGLAAARPRIEEGQENFFTSFAGIFHGFERREVELRSALEDENWKNAEYLLFGKKYHALAHLLDLVADGKGAWDPVERYVVMLTARDMVARLRKIAPAFWVEHKHSADELDARLSETSALAAKLKTGDDFLGWFEATFEAAFDGTFAEESS